MAFVKDTNYKNLIQSTRWRKLRNTYLQQHPICEYCHTKLATEVHHIEPLMKYRNDLYMMEKMCFDEDNLMSVCHECHYGIHRELGKYSHKQQDVKDLVAEKLNKFNEEYFK